MSKQQDVFTAPGPRFVGDVFPAAAENGDSFLYTASNPKSLHVWDGNPGAGHWIFWGYLRDIADAYPGTAGYFCGGQNAVHGAERALIDKLTFQTEAISSITSGLTSPRIGAQTGMTLSSGYVIGGGIQNVPDASINRLTFSSEAVAAITSSVQYSLRFVAANPQSAFAAYSAGGCNANGGAPYLASIEKLVFSSENTATVSATLTYVRGYIARGLQTPSIGYIAGGMAGSASMYAFIERLVFSGEVVSIVSSSLSVARETTAAGSSWANGYVLGGCLTGGIAVTAVCDRVVFSSETVSACTSLLNPVCYQGTFQSLLAVYTTDGYPSYLTSVSKYRFLDESVAYITSGITAGGTSSMGVTNYN
jgi:hypothetical protein